MQTQESAVAQNPWLDKNLFPLALGALGVVYGDIGTSPLYAMGEIFHGSHAIPATHENVYGILSLIFWVLNIIVSVKYIMLMMRADNDGEGGIMALLALALRAPVGDKVRIILIWMGLFGTALFYGDSMITPAISVLSAVEGLKIIPNDYKEYVDLNDLVVPLSVVILIWLFAIQHKGTEKVGIVFGPIMSLWFISLGLLGLDNIAKDPAILQAINPLYAFNFLVTHFFATFLALGAVVLVLTGAEALYADMGHFGRRPIQCAWFSLVLPALVLNYFGQGALILHNPAAVENPFYLLAPDWALYPLVLLATCATVIASQAVISGAFSMTHQAIQLGYLPRLRSVYTSHLEGQIYIPVINWGIMLAVLALIVGFKSSTALAGAYGIAVTGTMVITTILALVVIHYQWHWSWLKSIALLFTFFIIDLTFFSANLEKIPTGGWFPLLLAGIIFTVMLIWKTGRNNLHQKKQSYFSIESFADKLANRQPLLVNNVEIMPLRVKGTAIYMTSNLKQGVPAALINNLRHNKIAHERIIFLTGQVKDVPFIKDELKRIEIKALAENCYQMTLCYGFHQHPNVKRMLEVAEKYLDFQYDVNETSFFLGRETLLAKDLSLSGWQVQIFTFLFRNASSPVTFFNVPAQRVIEIGEQIRL
jgi:KUP system potassium uptake protein